MDFTKLLDHPSYELVMPSTQQKITFRPFLEKERVVLLMALESQDAKEMLRVVKRLIESCCETKDLDISNLTQFDVEYFFINLRARSVGEIMTLHYRCQHNSCNHIFPVDVNLTEVKVEGITKEKTIKLSPKLQLKMKYPHLTDQERTQNDLRYECVDVIYTDEGAYTSRECSKEDVLYLFEHLTLTQMDMIDEFIASSPKPRKTIDQECPKCHYKHHIIIEGFESFFV